MASTLHVFTGDHAATRIRGAIGIAASDTLIQHDVISCGPVRSFESRDEWIRVRDDFWNEVCGGPNLEEFPEDLVIDAEKIARYDRVRLWVGAGLSDRLLMPAVLRLADITRLTLPPMEVASITSHRAISVPVLGWGMLKPDMVGKPAATLAGPEALMHARRAWAGLTAQAPSSLLTTLDLIEADDALLAAMSTLIWRYPDAQRGLSYWDAALLAAIPNTGSDALTIIGGAIAANHHWLDPVGDVYLFWRLRRMASQSLVKPLLRLTGGTDVMRTCRVSPTAFGIDVRDGRANAAAINGVDDWIGGVHLRQAHGSPWYRDGDRLLHAS